MGSLRKKVLFVSMVELSQIMTERMITKSDITRVAKNNGLSISEATELGSLYVEMHKIAPKKSEDVTESQLLEIISMILYPEKDDLKTNFEEAVEEARRVSTELLQLRRTQKRISLRYDLDIAQEKKLAEEIEKIIEERKEEEVDIDSFCEEVIDCFLKSPDNISSFIEKAAKEKNIDKEELKSLLIQQLIQMKN